MNPANPPSPALDTPALDTPARDDDAREIRRLLNIMARLRAPDGCPWDQEQDFDSIAPYTIEDSIPKLVEVILGQRGRPGLRYLDREGQPVPW